MALKEESIDIIDECETDLQGVVKSEALDGYLEEPMLDDPIAGKSLVLIRYKMAYLLNNV